MRWKADGMGPDLLVPLLLPLASWPVARWLAPRVAPRFASGLFTVIALVLAGGSTAALLVAAAAGLSQLPLIAQLGEFSPTAFRAATSVSIPVAIASGALLAAVALEVVRAAIRYRRWYQRVHAELDGQTLDGGVVVLPGTEPIAFAIAGRGGRIALSSGMLAVLGPDERVALLAHERAHLRLRHPVYAAAATLASALNPFVRPLGTAARFAMERWADEAAASRVGDRRLVATAVAKAALAGRNEAAYALAATSGPVPQRVHALLDKPSARPGRGPLAALAVAFVLGCSAWSAVASLQAAADLHAGIESAQRAECRPVLTQGTDDQALLTAVREDHRDCAER
jgi:Zn-dependent protease with chaperone function